MPKKMGGRAGQKKSLSERQNVPPGTKAAAQPARDAGAEALHSLHDADVAHGRPSLRDMMWDGTRIAFIDFERFGATRELRRAKAMDLLLFAHSCFDVAGGPRPEIDHAFAAYRSRDRDGVWGDAARMLRRYRWLDPLVSRLPKLRDSHDVKAGQLVFRTFLSPDSAAP